MSLCTAYGYSGLTNYLGPGARAAMSLPQGKIYTYGYFDPLLRYLGVSHLFFYTNVCLGRIKGARRRLRALRHSRKPGQGSAQVEGQGPDGGQQRSR